MKRSKPPATVPLSVAVGRWDARQDSAAMAILAGRETDFLEVQREWAKAYARRRRAEREREGKLVYEWMKFDDPPSLAEAQIKKSRATASRKAVSKNGLETR